ncbi:multisubstrate pseudouridine synthase 7 [Coemansia sp. Cherry 401B]|nr:multisubstrate pseudouridine synthase 7 [Coemansia sp. RSA 2704]KAJ2717593.1 multisubstrate pseudouridine synthase 7 [Coemansia sp. Cherry 401B]
MAAPDTPVDGEQGPAKRIRSDADAPATPTPPATFLREPDVGISEFITPGWHGFTAIIKHRYADFFVNEIDPQGRVVHLTSYTDADDPEPPKTDVEKQIDELNVPADAQEAFDQAFVRLEPVLGTEDTQRIKQHLETVGEQTLEQRSLILDRELDKDQRKHVYLITNNFLPRQVTCETVDGKLKFIRRMPDDKPPKDNRRGGTRGPAWPHAGDFCYFVMQKENHDSLDVLQQIARALRCKPRAFGMAGTKDKRGITVQRCSAFRIAHDRLINVSRKLRGARLGNFSYGPRELRLGDLSGNQFQIVLRQVQGADAQSLQPVLDGIQHTGFINYYGMQRFGTQSISSHTIGISVLKADWQQAVDLIMSPRVGERPEVSEARELWCVHRDAKAAMAKLSQRAALAEHSILQYFAKHGAANNYAGAFACIPRNMRLMYVHAYQSYIWNAAVSERLRLFGTMGPVPGDLAIKDHGFSNTAHTSEPPEAADSEQEDEGTSRETPVLVTTENVADFSIYDVVLPLPGWNVQYPEHQVKGVYNELMARDGLSPSELAEHPLKEYRLSGAYRRIVIRPRDFSFEWMRYSDDTLPLARSDSDAIENKHVPESIEFGDHLALKLKFDLPSSAYATMLLRELMRQETASGYQSQLSKKPDAD